MGLHVAGKTEKGRFLTWSNGQAGADTFKLITNSGRGKIMVIRLEYGIFKGCTGFNVLQVSGKKMQNSLGILFSNLRKRVRVIPESCDLINRKKTVKNTRE